MMGGARIINASKQARAAARLRHRRDSFAARPPFLICRTAGVPPSQPASLANQRAPPSGSASPLSTSHHSTPAE